MWQVLFWLPIYTEWTPHGVPVYGFGAMLFLAYLAATWLIHRRAVQAGIVPEHVLDATMWIFISGLLGARVVYMIQYERPWFEFFQFWKGGIVFYGSFIGGCIGYMIFYFQVLRRFRISTWQVADVLAPAVCVGLCIGRLGCFLNGCCYGYIAPPEMPQVQFPLVNTPPKDLTVREYQSLFGFDTRGLGSPVVEMVEPGSAAYKAGLRRGDVIVRANGQQVTSNRDLLEITDPAKWLYGPGSLTLTVRRAGSDVILPAFTPLSLGLHPTQLYESISMVLLCLVLLTFHPLRRHDGQTFVLMMVGYAIHRFINESIRRDTDPVLASLTLSQTISILIILSAAILEWYLNRTQPKLAHHPSQSPGQTEGLKPKMKVAASL